ncbi:ABC transporter ATP-binding protein [Pseudoalteromonas ardens]|uniref:ABC transporter ATP-binding protein n=1 Tax=Pseudoalteromonas ardens TaxID=3048490 RepID=UPI0024C42838|nr:ABC transporter ATP-binding protein [Pseudoalteromonas sp. R96]MDK1313310.1 ABC transporter ATP-binding protein [Pseudoalteromonas sp. R96]
MEQGIRFTNVSKVYSKGNNRVVVHQDLNLAIEKGEFIALMGPSGSGKTTLLHMMGGLDKPTSGEVMVAGKLVSASSEAELTRWRARHVGFVFQTNHLLPVLSAFDNVELPLTLTKLTKARRKSQVETALSLVEMSQRADHFPKELSGGQEQRVAIARAIVTDPDVLLCDEPTGNLDRKTADAILSLLRVLNQEFGKTIVMVTHDGKAAEYASRVINLESFTETASDGEAV